MAKHFNPKVTFRDDMQSIIFLVQNRSSHEDNEPVVLNFSNPSHPDASVQIVVVGFAKLAYRTIAGDNKSNWSTAKAEDATDRYKLAKKLWKVFS